MADFGVSAIGAGAALGAAVYAAAAGFAARHESNHSSQVTETRRHIADFEAAFERGEVSEDDWQNYLDIRRDARDKESEYEESIDAYKETPLYLFLRKWKKRRQVRKKKKGLRTANRSLRNHYYESTSESSDTSSITAASGSPTRGRKAHSDEDDERILSWAEDVSSNSDDDAPLPDINNEGRISSISHRDISQPSTGIPAKNPHISSESQTPFGLDVGHGLSTALGVVPNSSITASADAMVLNGPVPRHLQEYISTIFVVGFPDDFHEREFQNMFTFSPGFEAAKLIIPNKENNSPSYGTTAAHSAALHTASSSSLPPGFVPHGSYNPISGEDGMSSRPANGSDDDSGQFLSGGDVNLDMHPRNRIIGFAKFRTRQEAIHARDHLQGRCVDIEKGAILKAEMAEKDLCPKRGVGLPSGKSVNDVPPDATTSNAPCRVPDICKSFGNDTRKARDRKDSAARLGSGHRAMRVCDEDDRMPTGNDPVLRSMFPKTSHNTTTRLSDNEHNNNPQSPILASRNPHEIPASPYVTWSPVDVSPWNSFSHRYTGRSSSALPIEKKASSLADTPLMETCASQGLFNDAGSNWLWSIINGISHNGMKGTVAVDGNPSRAVIGWANRDGVEGIRPSGSSSSATTVKAGEGVDDNTINTLHVGNLPTSPNPVGYPPDTLEENLRALFQLQPGYRRLVFRQKSNGPMCFVEFEGVQFATRALNDLYGNTVNGLVKGGIRLSYRKNPLGVRSVRTPRNYLDLIST